MIYGYARVSTAGQGRDGNSLQAQQNEMERAGAEKFFFDTFTGTRSDRPHLTRLLGMLQTGDTLMVTKIDRLGRSVIQVNEIISDLLERGISVHVLNMGMMDNSATGQLMRTMMLAFAQFERDMIVQRTQEGKAVAKQRPGYHEGRRPKYTNAQLDHAMELLETNSYTQVARLTGISKATLCRERSKRKNAQNSQEACGQR